MASSRESFFISSSIRDRKRSELGLSGSLAKLLEIERDG